MRFVLTVILVALALLFGASLGAVAKFGFGYDMLVKGGEKQAGLRRSEQRDEQEIVAADLSRKCHRLETASGEVKLK